MGSDNEPKMQANGMPDMDAKEKSGSGLVMLLAMIVIPLGIGFGTACAIHSYGNTSAYEKNMKPLLEHDYHWVYLAAVIFGRMICFVNMYPMSFKSKIMRFKSGNLRANMYVYKSIGNKAPNNAVVMEDEGEVGAYNRANRSMHHMVENFGTVIIALALVGAVYPFPMFLLTSLFALGRIFHQVGYTTGYGGHGVGFALSGVIVTPTVEGLCLLVALKGFGVAI